jgi:hypothetical protein
MSTIDAVSRGTATSVVNNIVTSEATAGIKAKVDQEVKQANTGLDFGFFFIIVALVLIGVLYFVFKHNPATMMKKGLEKTAEGVTDGVAGVTGAKKSFIKPLIVILGLFGTAASVVYGLMRFGVIDNPLAPEAAR